jgi:hypothetical protein
MPTERRPQLWRRAEASVGDAIICAGVRPPGCSCKPEDRTSFLAAVKTFRCVTLCFSRARKIRCAWQIRTDRVIHVTTSQRHNVPTLSVC